MIYSIVYRSEVGRANRFDADYFKPEYLEIERKLERANYNFLGNLSEEPKYGTTPKGGIFEKEGIPFLRSQDFKQFFVNLDDVNFCTKEFHKKNKKSNVIYKDILIACVGSVGEIGFYLETKEANINQNIGRIRAKNINAFYLFIYLLSYFGNSQLRRLNTGNVQEYLNSLQLKKIKIPILLQTFQSEVEGIVKKAHEKQNQAKELCKHAETLLLKELGLLGYEPKNRLSFETTKQEVDQAKRFDAEYFQPKYKKIIEKIEEYKGGFDLVKNIFNFNNTNFFPKENQLYNYIPLSKVSSTGEIGISEQQELGKHLPTRARRKVKEGDIILSSISGSLETSALIEEEHKNCIVSNGFYVFNSQKINSETLLVLFKSKIMIELLQRISKGTILEGYDITTFETLKIPLISDSIQTEIAKKVTESHCLRNQSKDFLNIAKQAVELAIEKGEVAGIDKIEDKIENRDRNNG